ncbi:MULTISPECIES: HAAS signaling domain-containing protein [unclassified Streptomyces]|uniref:HAAS signaling domain-containing protein n=1 Tax=unclassified Streptomyces TaxID=2593676 RepID=UPI00344D4D81
MTRTAHPLVTDYLETVEREASFLPAGRREELLADLREHLDVAVGDERDPETVRAALDRLGSPAAIVAAARAEEPEAPAAPRPEGAPKSRTTHTAVVLGATGVAGYAHPLLGLAVLIAGLVMLWTSDAWERGTKALATVLVSLTPLALLLTFVLGGAGRIGVFELLALLVAGVVLPVTAAVRLIRAARRTATP